MNIYEKIKRLCEAEGFFISNLGDKIPGLILDKSTVSMWKKGSRPKPSTLKMIAEYFGKGIISKTKPVENAAPEGTD